MATYTNVKTSSKGITPAFTGGNTKGNFIVLLLHSFPSAVTAVNDTQLNVYSKIGTFVISGGEQLEIWIAPNINGGTTTNTLTATGTVFNNDAVAEEFSGTLPAVVAADKISSGASGGSATSINPSIAPTGINNLYLLCAGRVSGSANWSINDGFTALFSTSNQDFAAAYLIASGTQAPTLTWNVGGGGSTINWLYLDIAAGLAGIPNSFMLLGVGT